MELSIIIYIIFLADFLSQTSVASARVTCYLNLPATTITSKSDQHTLNRPDGQIQASRQLHGESEHKTSFSRGDRVPHDDDGDGDEKERDIGECLQADAEPSVGDDSWEVGAELTIYSKVEFAKEGRKTIEGTDRLHSWRKEEEACSASGVSFERDCF